MRKAKGNCLLHRLDVAGAGFLAATLLVAFAFAVPHANSDKKAQQVRANSIRAAISP
jgi:hypothetical protein